MMDNHVKTEEQGFVRDVRSKALLNTDVDALRMYKARRLKHKENEARIESLEQQMGEILSLLRKLVEG